eukprot:TRINITY_DN10875_c0_g1_i1.p1 TRINITY_DN10875_c0_g1~~TRINITY_DN10875_c0_g1_i1.p1  ORF type:complete len:355 (-),score=68.77 TRINITY_DN10875_c0_g1_i1:53-1117(-)
MEPSGTAETVEEAGASPNDETRELPAELRHVLLELGAAERDERTKAARGLHGMRDNLPAMMPALIETLKAGTGGIRVGAAYVLGSMGAIAGPTAVPVLVESLGDDDRDLSMASTEALVNIGKPAISSLVSALDDNRINIEAMTVLGKIGAPIAAPAVPALERTLESVSTSPGPLRFLVAAALAQASGPKRAGWQTGAAVLRDGFRDESLSMMAMEALRFVPTAAAVPALLEELAGEREERRNAARETLVCIGGEAVPLLIQALESTTETDAQLFCAVASIFGEIGQFCETAVPMLMHKILSGPTEQRCAALRLLASVGEKAGAALPMLSMLARDDDLDQEIRACAETAIRAIEA